MKIFAVLATLAIADPLRGHGDDAGSGGGFSFATRRRSTSLTPEDIGESLTITLVGTNPRISESSSPRSAGSVSSS